MATFWLIPVTIVVLMLIRLAVAAWLTRPGSTRDVDEFLRVFNGLKGLAPSAKSIKAWGKMCGKSGRDRTEARSAD